MIESSKKLWLALVLGAGLFSLSLMQSAWAVNIRVTLVPNFDGTYDTAFPAGDKPAQPPSWLSTPSPVFTEGVASSYDVSADYASDIAVTLSDGAGCTLPTGVTVDDGNKQLDASTGTSEGTTVSCTLVIDDGISDPVTSPTFSIVINAAAESGITVDDSGGQDYTTIQAAADAAACGDAILVYNGTYGHFATTRNCTQGNEITVKAQTGETAVTVTGYTSQNGEEANVHCAHQYWVIGEGMTFQGSNPKTYQAGAVTGDPETNAYITANNCTLKGTFIQGRISDVRLAGVQRFVLSGAHVSIGGTMDRGPSFGYNDAGAALSMNSASNNHTLIVNTFIGEGGHNAVEQGSGGGPDNTRIEDSRIRNNWDLVYVDELDLNRGNRAGEFDGTGVTFRNNVFSDTRGPSTESNGNIPIFKSMAIDFSMAEQFLLSHTGGGPAISFQAASGAATGASNQYLDHFTMHNIDGPCFSFLDNGAQSEFGPFYIKNGICSNPLQNPIGTQNTFCIYIRYRSSYAPADRGDWQDYIFFENVAFSADCKVRINNATTGTNTPGSYKLSDLIEDYPANFVNIVIGDPAFVGTTVSTSEDPSTAIASAKANFIPQTASYLNCSDCYLTTVDGVVSNSVTVPVVDAGWFRDDGGFDEATPDQITLCGATRTVESISTNTLTLSAAVTCAGGEGVFRGPSATPNIGAVLN